LYHLVERGVGDVCPTTPMQGDSELREVKCELQELKAHIRLGDYAGKVFNDLKKN